MTRGLLAAAGVAVAVFMLWVAWQAQKGGDAAPPKHEAPEGLSLPGGTRAPAPAPAPANRLPPRPAVSSSPAATDARDAGPAVPPAPPGTRYAPGAPSDLLHPPDSARPIR